MFIDKDIFNF